MSNKVIVNGVDMIELIERDTPKPPIKITIHAITQHNCSACKRRLYISQLKEVNFCPKCGQRIDWRNE